MKLMHLMICGAITMTGGAAMARDTASNEARFANLIEGRIKGKPETCIQPRSVRSTEQIRDVGVVYTMNDGTIYLNRPNGGAAFLRNDDILVTRTFSGQLCRLDIVDLLDRNTRMVNGAFGLNDFIPYRKPSKVRAGS